MFKRIRNIENYYIKESYPTGFRVCYQSSKENSAIIELLAIKKNFYTIPNQVKNYKMTQENVFGRKIICKDLPKIEKEIHVIRRSPHHIEYDYIREVYQKKMSTPLLLKIAIEEDENGVNFITSPILSENTSEEEILMYFNLFKNLFGNFQIRNPFFKEVTKINTTKEWHILPKGNKLYSDEGLVKQIAKDRKCSEEAAEKNYFNLIRKSRSEINVGKEGFRGYYAFIYDDLDYVIMEKFIEGNATYIFHKKDWDKLSRLSKTTVMLGRLYIARIIHNEKWNERISVFLQKKNTD